MQLCSSHPGQDKLPVPFVLPALRAEDGAIAEAYERTCLNTGGMNWAYMNKILQRWHSSGLHTADAVKNSDHKNVPKGASGELGAAELEAIQKVLRGG